MGMDVAGRNSAVECRSARAFSSLEIAYCLSGIGGTDAGWLLCVVAAPGHGVVLERSCFCWRRGGIACVEGALGEAYSLWIKTKAFFGRHIGYMDLEYLRSRTDGPGRHAIPVTGKIFTSAQHLAANQL